MSQGFSPDPAQREALDALADLRTRLLKRRRQRRGWRGRLRRMLPRTSARSPERGLYLWGGVGRGKTWLMDQFVACLPEAMVRRQHFHRFMHWVHEALSEHRDEADPLASIADRVADDCCVICFDEFHVSDIADAMLLGRLFTALFERGVTLVATSNMAPEDLYRDGLQRARFLPAIAEIERHCEVLHVDGGVDYRLRVLERAEIYHSPSDAQAERNLERWFLDINGSPGERDRGLRVNGRPIGARRRGDGIAWFGFAALCDGPRSAEDYIELARTHHTVLLSGVPVLDRDREDEARRFISMVDEFYDRSVKLIVAADAPLEDLYQGRRLSFEFERTRSRLLEMRSHDYLAREHLP